MTPDEEKVLDEVNDYFGIDEAEDGSTPATGLTKTIQE